MGATCRPNCGACCDPVTIPYSQAEAVELGEQGRLDPHHVWWVTHILEPMRPRDARDIAPYLFTPAMKAAVGPELNDVLTFYYRCSWFDRETRTCTHYDERPTVCQKYPWHYFGHPVENAALPPMCSYNADIDRPVEDVPVAWLGRKPDVSAATPDDRNAVGDAG